MNKSLDNSNFEYGKEDEGIAASVLGNRSTPADGKRGMGHTRMGDESLLTTEVLLLYVIGLPLLFICFLSVWQCSVNRYFQQEDPPTDRKSRNFIQSATVAPILNNLPHDYKFPPFSCRDGDDNLSVLMASSTGSLVSLSTLTSCLSPCTHCCRWLLEYLLKKFRRREQLLDGIPVVDLQPPAYVGISGQSELPEHLARVSHFFQTRFGSGHGDVHSDKMVE